MPPWQTVNCRWSCPSAVRSNSLRGKGSLQLTSLTYQGRALGEMRATLELANQTARTDLRWRAQERELLQVQGSVGLSANGVLAMQIRAPDLPLEMLQGLVPGLTHSEGTLNLDLQRPYPATATTEWSLVLNNGALQLAATGERYRDIQIRIVMTGIASTSNSYGWGHKAAHWR